MFKENDEFLEKWSGKVWRIYFFIKEDMGLFRRHGLKCGFEVKYMTEKEIQEQIDIGVWVKQGLILPY